MPNALLAMQMLFQLIDRAVAVKAMLDTAHKTGVDLTKQQLDSLFAADDAARAALLAEINKQKTGG